MTRSFRADPLPPDTITELVDLASRAPSAGKSQGWHLIVLEGAGTARFWDITLPPARRESFRWQHLLEAPAIALPLADPQAYLDRYAEPDKAATRLGAAMDAWPVPYWTVDASMAVMTLLLAAEDAGLGALFFGVFEGAARLLHELAVPEHLELLGAIALGYPANDIGADARSAGPGASAGRRRRRPGEIIHAGGW